jgi:putative hemolysin
MAISLLNLIIVQTPSFIVLGVLLIASGIIGGTETALFSLTHYDRADLRNVSDRMARIVERLLKKPEQLLLAVLVANMAVNSLIFAISSILVYQAVHAHHPLLASAIGLGTVLSLVLFSEILAKSWIYYLRIPVTALVAGPMWVLIQFLRPVLALIEKFLLGPLVRLSIGTGRERQLSQEELLRLFEISGREGYLQPAQIDLLTRVVELRNLRVRQVMVPRVNITSCEIHQPVEEVRHLIRQTHRSRIAAYVYQVDYIVGMIRSRRLLVEQPHRLKDILEPVKFVPENQRVDQLLYFFHKQRTDVAMVVDEYGGLVGMVSLEELMEKTLGALPAEFPEPDAPQMIRVSPGEYLADGHLPLADLFERLDLPAVPMEFDTLAGLVLHLTGHLPAQGETLDYEGLKLVVKELDATRIEKIQILDTRQR